MTNRKTFINSCAGFVQSLISLVYLFFFIMRPWQSTVIFLLIRFLWVFWFCDFFGDPDYES